MLKRKDNITGFTFLIPALVLLMLVVVYPLINAFHLSFYSQLIYQLKGRFVGLANYIESLHSPDFWYALWLSFVWTVSTVFAQVIMGVGAAVLLQENFKGRTLARALVLLPFFMPTIAVTLMWKWLLDPNFGIFNYLLMKLHLIENPISWLGSSNFALFSLIFIGIWRFTPFIIINILARLQVIPTELYEAAEIDGASKWNQFRYITLPEIKGVLLVVILLRSIFMFKKVDMFLILTGGGPGSSTQTLPVLIYKSAFQAMRVGKGSADAIITFFIVTVFIVLYMRFAMRNQESD